jgi:hypothetical protein
MSQGTGAPLRGHATKTNSATADEMAVARQCRIGGGA